MLQNEILKDLELQINQIIKWAESLREVDNSKLRAKPSENSWSALECIDHLNRYSEFYLPVFTKAIDKSPLKKSEKYKPGWLGNKLAQDILPQNGKLKSTMKTFKSKDPALDGVKPNALDNFIDFQMKFLVILDNAKTKNLEALRVSTTLPMIRLKLGDALRFVIFHEVRHVVQAKKALNSHD